MTYAGEITKAELEDALERLDREELRSVSVSICYPWADDYVSINGGPALLLVDNADG